MNARLSVIAACAGVALAVTGCSGGAAPSTQTAAPTTTTTAPAADPVKWVGTFCGGTTPVLAGGGELTSIVTANAGNPAALKEGVLKVLDGGAKSLAESAKKLTDVGAPAPEAKPLNDELVKLFSDGAAESQAIAEQVRKLDATAPDFMAQIQKLGAAATGPAKLSAAIAKLDADPKSKDALAKAPECVEMRTKLAKLMGQ
ncbi:hypothetical protein [Lentzea terrae]|uniref:hypothetical protein n=1 Tax=Lentzea terrae TaxID=2200761 RepID=UPI0013005781|nr:hypothetical protein [Lentzea terrae]